MEELRRRLQDVVDSRYQGKARPASIDAKLNPNQIGNILAGATQAPELETIAKLSAAFGWRLEDVVCWALGQEEAPCDPDPLTVIEQQLARLKLPDTQRQAVMTVIRQFVPSDKS